MKYQLAIFDMDGTILNTLDDLADSVNYALRKCQLPQRTIEEVRGFVGNGIRKLIERAVPENSDDTVVEQVHGVFQNHYKEHCAEQTRPYDGIVELLKKLKENGVSTAVVSNKIDEGVQSLCKDYFPGLFDVAVGEREGIKRKPSPDSVYLVLQKLGIEKEDAVYIGDSDVDYQTSKNAGIDVIMVGWGFRTEQFLKQCGAPFVVHEPNEVLKYILNENDVELKKTVEGER